MVDCRRLTDGGLFVTGGREWAYTTATQGEFHEHVTWGEYEYSIDGGRAGPVYLGGATPDTRIDRMVEPPDPD